MDAYWFIVALLFGVTATWFAAYHAGLDAGKKAHQCADELALVAESKGRHPSRCQECG